MTIKQYDLGKVLLLERIKYNVLEVRWWTGGVIINNQKVTRWNIFDFPILLISSSRCFSVCYIEYDTPAGWPDNKVFIIVLKDDSFILYLSKLLGRGIGEVYWVFGKNSREVTEKFINYQKMFASAIEDGVV